jgi:hypothetical protein
MIETDELGKLAMVIRKKWKRENVVLKGIVISQKGTDLNNITAEA